MEPYSTLKGVSCLHFLTIHENCNLETLSTYRHPNRLLEFHIYKQPVHTFWGRSKMANGLTFCYSETYSCLTTPNCMYTVSIGQNSVNIQMTESDFYLTFQTHNFSIQCEQIQWNFTTFAIFLSFNLIFGKVLNQVWINFKCL